ncbi:serine hydrolase domain-containing protein, partial [Kitasatospora sp. NPDC093806]|uniref:serine hydrolase domain-containing protein n=1 Tax=Kitasatospora sp. NPDC093806 TaxID=3155075 RepID=UPI00341D7396
MDDAYLHELLTGLARAHRVPGAQLVVRSAGRWAGAVTGTTAVDGGGPVERDSAFPVSSLTKPFTAALVLMLAADGDLDLDEPVTDQLPEAGLESKATLRQLLSHTGGLAANLPEEDGHPDDLARWVAKSARRLTPVAEPGAAFSYSNVGYVLAGRLVERTTGMSWARAMEVMLLRPLGLPPGSAPGGGRPPVPGHLVRRSDGLVVP